MYVLYLSMHCHILFKKYGSDSYLETKNVNIIQIRNKSIATDAVLPNDFQLTHRSVGIIYQNIQSV